MDELVDRRISDVPDLKKGNFDHTVRAGRDAVSAVKMSERLTADVDAWAAAHGMVRSDAICELIELGLRATPSTGSIGCAHYDPVSIEDQAVRQIGELLDPSLSIDERERRIRRLTEGPPEFSDERIDLPKPKK